MDHQPFEILVFKTGVRSRQDVEALAPALENLPGIIKWNFDLKDCDNILRVVGRPDLPSKVIDTLNTKGFECIELS